MRARTLLAAWLAAATLLSPAAGAWADPGDRRGQTEQRREPRDHGERRGNPGDWHRAGRPDRGPPQQAQGERRRDDDRRRDRDRERRRGDDDRRRHDHRPPPRHHYEPRSSFFFSARPPVYAWPEPRGVYVVPPAYAPPPPAVVYEPPVVYREYVPPPAPAGFGIGEGTCNRAAVAALLSGQTAALWGGAGGPADGTIGGGIAGPLVGGFVGQAMDEIDQNCVGQALERARTGQAVAWANPEAGGQYTVQPTRTWYADDGRPCREFLTTGQAGGGGDQVFGAACRNPDGRWQTAAQ